MHDILLHKLYNYMVFVVWLMIGLGIA